MSSKPILNVTKDTISASLPANNAGNYDLVLGGFPGAVIEVEAVDTSPVVKCYVKKRADGTWRKWGCYQQAVDVSTKTYRDADASITLSAGDQIIVLAPGFYAVRLDLQSGTSATLAGSTADEIGEFITAASGTGGAGDASAANQNTMITHLSQIETAVELLDDVVYADDGTGFTIATSKAVAVGGVIDETSSDTAAEHDFVVARFTPDRQQRVHTSGAEVQTGLSIASGSNQTIVLNGAPGLAVEVTAVDTSPVITVTGILASGGTARNIECIQMTGGYGRLRVGGTSISLAAADRLYIIGDYYSVTLTYSSGTSATVTTRTMTQTAANKILAAPIELKPLSNQNITAATLASAQTLTVPTGATGAWITVIEGTLGTAAGLFMTTEGSTPSATEGTFIKASNLPFEMSGRDLIAGVKFIADGSTTARLSAEFFEEVIRIG